MNNKKFITAFAFLVCRILTGIIICIALVGCFYLLVYVFSPEIGLTEFDKGAFMAIAVYEGYKLNEALWKQIKSM